MLAGAIGCVGQSKGRVESRLCLCIEGGMPAQVTKVLSAFHRCINKTLNKSFTLLYGQLHNTSMYCVYISSPILVRTCLIFPSLTSQISGPQPRSHVTLRFLLPTYPLVGDPPSPHSRLLPPFIPCGVDSIILYRSAHVHHIENTPPHIIVSHIGRNYISFVTFK